VSFWKTVFLRQRSKGKKKPDAPPRYRKETDDLEFIGNNCARPPNAHESAPIKNSGRRRIDAD